MTLPWSREIQEGVKINSLQEIFWTMAQPLKWKHIETNPIIKKERKKIYLIFNPPSPFPPHLKSVCVCRAAHWLCLGNDKYTSEFNGFRSWTFHYPTEIIPQIIKNFIYYSFNSTQWHCQEWRTYVSTLYYRSKCLNTFDCQLATKSDIYINLSVLLQ